MAEGVRIRHKTMSNVLLAVRDRTSRVDPPYPGCGRCGIPAPGHEGFKTRHFDLDSDGFVIVSTTVLDKLRALVDHGGFDLSSTNPVPNPPAQGINMNKTGRDAVTLARGRAPEIVTTRPATKE